MEGKAENKEKKNTHGGKREGAGRKKTNHGKYYGFNSTPEVERILESLDGVSKTEFINEAITLLAEGRI